jgi:hypothetical protein
MISGENDAAMAVRGVVMRLSNLVINLACVINNGNEWWYLSLAVIFKVHTVLTVPVGGGVTELRVRESISTNRGEVR